MLTVESALARSKQSLVKSDLKEQAYERDMGSTQSILVLTLSLLVEF